MKRNPAKATGGLSGKAENACEKMLRYINSGMRYCDSPDAIYPAPNRLPRDFNNMLADLESLFPSDKIAELNKVRDELCPVVGSRVFTDKYILADCKNRDTVDAIVSDLSFDDLTDKDILLRVGTPLSPQDAEIGGLLCILAEFRFNSLYGVRMSVGAAAELGIKLGAKFMHYAMENPDGELVAKLDKLLGIDFSKAAEKGVERVFHKRKQDRRKSSDESKRKASAIAMMKKLVPEIGQVMAADEVKRRMKTLTVEAGTVRRWYNAKLEEEREARKAAEKARLGRRPT